MRWADRAQRHIDQSNRAADDGHPGVALDYALAAIQVLLNHIEETEEARGDRDAGSGDPPPADPGAASRG